MKSEHGFTLLELAIVIVIIGALLSYAFLPLRAQLENANIKKAQAKILEIEEALYGYAIANRRMPCPTFPGQNGLSVPQNPADHCGGSSAIGNYIGFVPANTLSVKGETNCDGLLIDPWGRPYLYSVTNVDLSDGNGDFVVTDGIRAEGGAGAVTADLKICNDTTAACTAGATSFSADEAVAVIISMGNRGRANSNIENENAGEGTDINSTCGLVDYEIGNNRFYYSSQRLEQAGGEFDDIISWISPNILYAKMLQAGALP